ncbi:hypothetical protein LX15_001577 [Streptoalloteichus tenebrarius]|uniref:Integral membrane protein n=2 Tax=Streptoalloteichus tenebrarius (strain ATCC 17920 / DSM 40477 / JCM 4838 / CBS 697.72 / NBRC 16177 / NCIMB 11028 / NRRL B-12390 / A12253. 1 / ISP 5477) TaxID=1933 RepID=A0ABT1HQU4_STRSD|nr:hypothetical protein [Streptoalloteichus tenebrarius]
MAGTATTSTTTTTSPTSTETPDPVLRLAAEMESVCANAVDVLEIAAALEAQGVNDRAARRRYGVADVFALAELLHELVPPRPGEPVEEPCPWRPRPLTHVLRGALFGLPGLCTAALAPDVAGGAQVTVLVVALLLSWPLGQGLAYVGWSRLGRSDRGGAVRLLRRGFLLTSAVTVAVVAAFALAVDAGPAAAVLAGGQGVYLLGATVLLVLGAEWWLLAALAPALLACGVHLVLGQPVRLAWPVRVLVLGCLLAVVVLVALRTKAAQNATQGPLRWAEIGAAVPHAVFGVVAAGLLLVITGGVPTTSAHPAVWSAVPLSLSMGAAEWNLTWYRRRTFLLLRRTRRTTQFARRARGALLVACARYLTAAALLTTAGVALTSGRGITPGLVLAGATSVLLGGALFLALTLQAFGVNTVALATGVAALAVDAVIVFGPASLAGPDPVLAQVGVVGAWFAVLLAYAGAVLGRASLHG